MPPVSGLCSPAPFPSKIWGLLKVKPCDWLRAHFTMTMGVPWTDPEQIRTARGLGPQSGGGHAEVCFTDSLGSPRTCAQSHSLIWLPSLPGPSCPFWCLLGPNFQINYLQLSPSLSLSLLLREPNWDNKWDYKWDIKMNFLEFLLWRSG